MNQLSQLLNDVQANHLTNLKELGYNEENIPYIEVLKLENDLDILVGAGMLFHNKNNLKEVLQV